MRWEFWPPWLFYLPIGLNYLRLSIKYRGLSLPTCANPGMFTGGLIGESKHETLSALARVNPEWVASSILIREGDVSSRMARLEDGMQSIGPDFPIVLKPDVAQRGSGFKVVRTEAEAEAYFREVDVPVIAQRYIPGPHEAGLFYYRFPAGKEGRIFAITEKIFPVISGDGNRTVEELIRADVRAAIMAETYLRRFARTRVIAFWHRAKPCALSRLGIMRKGASFVMECACGANSLKPELTPFQRIFRDSTLADTMFVSVRSRSFEKGKDLQFSS